MDATIVIVTKDRREDQFDAEYLIVVSDDVRHPGLTWLHEGTPRAGLDPVHYSENLIIYEFDGYDERQ